MSTELEHVKAALSEVRKAQYHLRQVFLEQRLGAKSWQLALAMDLLNTVEHLVRDESYNMEGK